MNNFFLKRDQILEVDIETTGFCNLQCPLCLSRLPQFKQFFKVHNLELDKIISVLNSFPNLDQVTIAGDASEPTLYPYLFELLQYLNTRKNIYVEVFTNGSTHINDNEYWKKLAYVMPKKSLLVFTICGSTQRLHETYRVGSKLQDILNNLLIYKSARKNNPNDCMQYIKFEYNKNDNLEDLMKIKKLFTSEYSCNTNPIYERLFKYQKSPNGICLNNELQIKYHLNILKNKKNNYNIKCHMFDIKQLRIDNFGNIYPCSFYKFYHKNPNSFILDNDTFDYSDIYLNKCDFCYECTDYMSQFFKKYNCKQSFMC